MRVTDHIGFDPDYDSGVGGGGGGGGGGGRGGQYVPGRRGLGAPK